MAEQVTLTERFISGGFGAVCLVFVGHPLDTTKVRLQTMPVPQPGEPPKYSGTWDCILKTLRNEGIRGFFQGMGAPLCSAVPIFCISFYTYGLGERIFAWIGEKTILQYFLAGAFSGIFTTIIMAPAERIKCLLQIQQFGDQETHLYDGPVDCLVKLYKEEGISGVYRGSAATLVRDIPSSGVYFSTYEVVQDLLTDYRKKSITILTTLVAGGMAGVLFWVVGIPPDVLKSRLQTAPAGTYPNGIISVFVELMKTEGPCGLFRGITAASLRAFPANSACFLGIELCIKIMRYLYGVFGLSAE